MLIGYARVSTENQNLELQIDALKRAGCDQIFQETISGANKEKKELSEALKILREGDTLIVWKLDRLGRSLKSLIDFVTDLNKKKINFKSITDSIDTTTPMGKFFFHIMGSLSELERGLIHERTMAGLKAANQRGRIGGRPRAIGEKTFERASKMYDSNELSVGEICSTMGINRRTFNRYLNKRNTGDESK